MGRLEASGSGLVLGKQCLFCQKRSAVCLTIPRHGGSSAATGSYNKVKISGRTMNAIALDCPDNTFDFVYALICCIICQILKLQFGKCTVFSSPAVRLVLGPLEAQSGYQCSTGV